MRQYEYTVPAKCDGMRVQDYLMGIVGYSRRIITRLKQTRGDILLNGEHIRMVDPIKAGDLIRTSLYEGTHIKPEMSLVVPIVYEDSDIIVYNKPYNMPVHPSRNHQNGTLANAFCGYMQTNNIQATFRPINRLDRDTDGLCVVAKNAFVASKLGSELKKEYTAICCGRVEPPVGTIDAPIKRLDEFYIKRGVCADGQRCVTNYKTVRCNDKYTLVSVQLETGRTHQIRVHFSHMGYPLAGDDMYGGVCDDVQRHALTCTGVWFTHPITGEKIDLSIDLQDDLSKLV